MTADEPLKLHLNVYHQLNYEDEEEVELLKEFAHLEAESSEDLKIKEVTSIPFRPFLVSSASVLSVSSFIGI